MDGVRLAVATVVHYRTLGFGVGARKMRSVTSRPGLKIGNESVPKIILNDTIISILVISNHNSFRLTFDKIAPVYFI